MNKTQKRLMIVLLSIFLVKFSSLLAQTCDGTLSKYTIDAQATRDANSIAARGGTLNLVYVLTSGDPIPELGQSFTVPVNYSALNNTNGGTNNWAGISTLNANSRNYVVLMPVTNGANSGSIYHNLPAANKQSEQPTNPNSVDNFFTTRVNGGALLQLGSFSLDIGNYPTLPPGASVYTDSLMTISAGNLASNSTSNVGGYWLKPVAQTDIRSTASSTNDFRLSTGNSHNFKYSAFSSTSYPTNGGNRGTSLGGSVVFCYDRVLPVSFLSVKAAMLNNDSINVSWSTASEKNSDHFEIEVSKDGKNFVSIGTVQSKAANGNSNEVLQYSFSKATGDVTITTGILSVFMISIGLVAFTRKNRLLLAIIVLLGSGILTISCNKRNTDTIEQNQKLFVRIVQVDKEGGKQVSKTVITTTKE